MKDTRQETALACAILAVLALLCGGWLAFGPEADGVADAGYDGMWTP
jgi:hypothetical protein